MQLVASIVTITEREAFYSHLIEREVMIYGQLPLTYWNGEPARMLRITLITDHLNSVLPVDEHLAEVMQDNYLVLQRL